MRVYFYFIKFLFLYLFILFISLFYFILYFIYNTKIVQVINVNTTLIFKNFKNHFLRGLGLRGGNSVKSFFDIFGFIGNRLVGLLGAE